jgi:hypothetical protein
MNEAQARARAVATIEPLYRSALERHCFLGELRRELLDGSRPLHLIVAKMHAVAAALHASGCDDGLGDILKTLEPRSSTSSDQRIKRGDKRRKRKGHPPNVIYLDLHR